MLCIVARPVLYDTTFPDDLESLDVAEFAL